MSTSRAALVVLLIAFPQFAQAQYAEARPGARVRVEAPGVLASGHVATILARSADSLTLGSPDLAPLTIPVSRITRLELSRGTSRSEGAIRGAEWGAGVGVVLGLAFLPVAHSCRTCSDQSTDASIVTQMVLGSITWGVGIGALVGRERWERFDAGPRVSIAGNGRIGLSLDLAW